MEHFDHHSTEFAENWRDQYAQLRAKCPVAHTDSHGGYYVATSYDAIQQILHDPQRFVCGRDLDLGTGQTVPGGVTVPTNAVRMGMMEMDPPRSQELRRIVSSRFTAKAVKAYEPRLEQLVSWCLDRVIEKGSMDFVDDIANPLPALVTLDYLGLPLEKWEMYATTLHKAAYREKGSGRAVAAMLDDLHSIVRDRRENPRSNGDIVELVVEGEVDGKPLSEDLVVELLFMLLNGGIDTTTALIANTFLFLDDHHDERAWLSEDSSRIPGAVDEFIRYTSPSTGVARTVKEPVTVGGTELQAGDRILLALGSANADDNHFDDADQIHLDRQRNRHLSFGSGMHRCLGSFIAPAEMSVLIREVLRRMPDYQIDRSKVVAYPTIPLVNGHIAMPATFTPGQRIMQDILRTELPFAREEAEAKG
ncbi:cytochrome [Rhodococcus sp. SC4]|nr:cytochrome [Rhodococcus sp. SC4]